MPMRRPADEDDVMIPIQPHEIDRLIRHPRPWIDISGRCTLQIVALMSITFVLGMVTCVIFLPTPTPQSYTDKQPGILPRQTGTVTDWGSPTRFRGWLDIQRQGEPNDYVRYVGPTEQYPFQWLSIAFAGSNEQHTPPGLYEEHSGIVTRTAIKPRQIIPDIDKLGLPDYFKGWVDVQKQGVPNDYAYYAPPTEDIPYPWLTIALAGSPERRTCVSLYAEKYGRVRPTPVKEYYDRNHIVSCQQWTSILREAYDALLYHRSDSMNNIDSQSQSVYRKAVAVNNLNLTIDFLSSKEWRRLLPDDIFVVLSGYGNNSPSNGLSMQLYIILIAFSAINFALQLYKHIISS